MKEVFILTFIISKFIVPIGIVFFGSKVLVYLLSLFSEKVAASTKKLFAESKILYFFAFLFIWLSLFPNMRDFLINSFSQLFISFLLVFFGAKVLVWFVSLFSKKKGKQLANIVFDWKHFVILMTIAFAIIMLYDNFMLPPVSDFNEVSSE